MVILSIAIFVLCMAGLFILQRKKVSFNILVLGALGGAIAFGALLNRFDAGAVAQSMR